MVAFSFLNKLGLVFFAVSFASALVIPPGFHMPLSEVAAPPTTVKGSNTGAEKATPPAELPIGLGPVVPIVQEHTIMSKEPLMPLRNGPRGFSPLHENSTAQVEKDETSAPIQQLIGEGGRTNITVSGKNTVNLPEEVKIFSPTLSKDKNDTVFKSSSLSKPASYSESDRQPVTVDEPPSNNTSHNLLRNTTELQEVPQEELALEGKCHECFLQQDSPEKEPQEMGVVNLEFLKEKCPDMYLSRERYLKMEDSVCLQRDGQRVCYKPLKKRDGMCNPLSDPFCHLNTGAEKRDGMCNPLSDPWCHLRGDKWVVQTS
jgi:hypothetical protein